MDEGIMLVPACHNERIPRHLKSSKCESMRDWSTMNPDICANQAIFFYIPVLLRDGMKPIQKEEYRNPQ
jgi:hypothetical protein